MTPTSMTQEDEIVAYVGCDWADQQHVLCWRAADSTKVQTAIVRQRPEELQVWVAGLRQRFPQGRVALALEQSRGAVMAALMLVGVLAVLAAPREARHAIRPIETAGIPPAPPGRPRPSLSTTSSPAPPGRATRSPAG